MPCHAPRTARTYRHPNAAATSLESDLDLIILNACQPTHANPFASAKAPEIPSILEALNMPIPQESREEPYSNPLHGSLPSGLPGQYNYRGHATPNEVMRFIGHLPAACPPHTRQLKLTL